VQLVTISTVRGRGDAGTRCGAQSTPEVGCPSFLTERHVRRARAGRPARRAGLSGGFETFSVQVEPLPVLVPEAAAIGLYRRQRPAVLWWPGPGRQSPAPCRRARVAATGGDCARPRSRPRSVRGSGAGRATMSSAWSPFGRPVGLRGDGWDEALGRLLRRHLGKACRSGRFDRRLQTQGSHRADRRERSAAGRLVPTRRRHRSLRPSNPDPPRASSVSTRARSTSR
jgi:hypothetical protein